jgi:putative restriction endonuclease
MWRLRHAALLDAAHILADQYPQGIPAVSNGLALCKIHHAAYDQNILGVRPDFVIQVRTDILDEIDGPMLRHGLQEMHGIPLTLPSRRVDRPDQEAIEERYGAFRRTA